MKYSLSIIAILLAAPLLAADTPDYNRDVAPILNKYCVACHNADDLEGKLALDSYAAAMKGGAKGAIITPNSGAQSRLIRVLTGEAKPLMPPEDNEAPQEAEIAVLKAWIDGGAKGPSGEAPDPTILNVPRIEPMSQGPPAINALAVHPQGKILALARFGEVELVSAADGTTIRKLAGHRGRVNAIAFSPDGKLLAAAAGEPARFGEAKVWQVESGEEVRTYRGHKDCLYAVAISPDGQTVATAGYDQTINLWSLTGDKPLHTLQQHDGAIFALAFRNDGRVLASASEDRTVKLWNVAEGTRLDTLSQSTKELYTLAFAPDGQRLAAAGVDNRIRVWGISASAAEGTNPLVFSQFAHEAAVLKIAYAPDGNTLVSTGEDRVVKVWNANNMTIRSTLPAQDDWVSGVAVLPQQNEVFLTRLDGQTARFPLRKNNGEPSAALQPLDEAPPLVSYGPQPAVKDLPQVAEQEPNNVPSEATPLALPGRATGKISGAPGDVDLYRFTASKGDQWIIETNAARQKSALDSKLEVLHGDGQPAARLLLRAVRDSELEFRGMNSDQRGARLKYWEEIPLRQYIYLSGEVVKHFQQRRGPDADAQFYPEGGSRITYFDTTAHAHALGEPCYVVVPYAIGTELPSNGLPVFTLNYENDDDALRKLGKDSRLHFVAPADGEYLVRVSDVRNFAGDNHHYELIVRRPQPDFKVTLAGGNAEVGAASGKIITARVERMDGFNGPVEVDINGVPPGFTVTSPLVIEAGHYEAKGVVAALAHAPPTSEQDWSQVQVSATAKLGSETVTHNVNNLGTIKLGPRPKVVAHLLPVQKTPAELAPPPSAKPRHFTALVPEQMTSAAGATLTKLDDHSILASGDNPDADTYTITAKLPAGVVRAIRLEALGHDSLPSKAPGRAKDNGNFVLSEFALAAAPDKLTQVKFASATVDYTQPGWSAAAMIDGNAKTGWAIADPGPNNTYPVKKVGDDPSHHAIFELAEPLTLAADAVLTFTIQQAGDVKQHNLGRFRLSATSDEVVSLPLDFPAIPEVTIVPGRETQVRLKVEKDGFNARIPIEVENLPHGVIVNDIGLSGVLINPDETERVIFLYCEPWVAEQTRDFVAVAKVEGDQVSLPMRLQVRREGQ